MAIVPGKSLWLSNAKQRPAPRQREDVRTALARGIVGASKPGHPGTPRQTDTREANTGMKTPAPGPRAEEVRDGTSLAEMPVEELSIHTIRTLAIDAIQKANSGHPGAPMALAPVAYVLSREMRYNPRNPAWFDRDGPQLFRGLS